jgi:hypothetical protein
MIEIALAGGDVAIVDDSDFESVNQFRWRLWINKGRRYAVRATGTWTKGTYKLILMHRQILGLENCSRPIVDHWDRNGLHNWRTNLRPCNHSLNLANRDKTVINSSGFKGVYHNGRTTPKPWHARVGGRGSQIVYSEYFATAEEAAHRYDELAVQLYGQFAKLNFPNPVT